jgi:predicted TIM-barrel fold metal-dependent hydrolase
MCNKEKRLIGFMRLDPNCKKMNIKKEIDVGVKNNLKGIKLHPRSQNFTICKNKLKPIINLAEQFKLPILCDTNNLDPGSNSTLLVNLADKFKKVNFIAAHSTNISSDLKGLQKLKNYFVDTSCILNYSRLVYYVKCGNKHKVIFGSDYPYDLPTISKMKIELCGPNLGLPQKGGLTDKEKKLVLGDNAKKLLNLD